jgi:hypothetical protein
LGKDHVTNRNIFQISGKTPHSSCTHIQI